MIPGIDRTDVGLTAGLPELVLGPALARQALLNGRFAETMGNIENASYGFERALALLEAYGEAHATNPEVARTRAGALAGIARIQSTDPTVVASAAAAIHEIIDVDADAADLADRGSVQGAEARAELYEAAVSARGGAPAWTHHAFGDAALEAGDVATAVRELSLAVSGAPLSSLYQLAYARALVAAGEAEFAARSLMSAAMLVADGGDLESARQLVDEALELNEADLLARLFFADLLRATRWVDAAVDRLEAMSPEVPPGTTLADVGRLALARALAADGRRQDALVTLEPLLAAREPTPDALLLAAELQAMLEGDGSAEATLRSAVAVAPGRLDVLDALIHHHLSRGRLDEAVRAVEEAIEVSVDGGGVPPQLLVVLGELRHRAGLEGAPATDIGNARLGGLDPARAWSIVGEIRTNDGDGFGALEAYERALEIRPDASTHMQHALLMLESGLAEAAVSELETAARLEPENPEVQLQLGHARFRADDLEGAREALESALDTLPDHPLLLALRGTVRRAGGDTSGADDDLEESVRRDPWLGWPAAELVLLRAETIDDDAVDGQVVQLLAEVGGPDVVVAVARQLDAEYASPAAAAALITAYLETDEGARGDEPLVALVVARAMALEQIGHDADAERDLRHALDLIPWHAIARVRLAALLAERDAAGASQMARLAREHDPGSSEVAQSAVRVLAVVDGSQAALDELDGAVRQIGVDPDLLQLRAGLLLDAGQPDEAARVARELRERWPAIDVDLVEGTALARLREYERAAEILERVVSEGRADASAVVDLVECLVELGRPRDALEYIATIDPEDPAYDDAATYRALALAAVDEREQASNVLVDVVDRNPEAPWPRAELVQLAWDNGRHKLAKEHLNVLLADQALRDEPEIARLAWLAGDGETALARVDDILRGCDDNVVALALRAGILFERNDYDQAIDAARLALEREPDHANARNILVDAYVATDRLHEALMSVASSSDSSAELKRAEILFRLNEADAGTEAVERVLATTEQSDVEVVVEAADLLVWADRHERAISLLEDALADREPPPLVLRASGALLSSIGEFESAIAVLEACRELNAKEAGVDQELAWAYSNVVTPPFEALLGAVDRALEGNSDDPWLLKARADALLQHGDIDDAKLLYAQILEQRLESIAAPRDRHALAGWCCYRSGFLDRAADHLLRATSIGSPFASGERFDLALVLFAAGRPMLAVGEYERALMELAEQAGDLRRHGLLRVAYVDLTEAADNELVTSADAEEILGTMREAITACRPTFERFMPFFEHTAEAARNAGRVERPERLARGGRTLA